MTLSIIPLHPHVGAQVDGVDLSKPISDDTMRQIEEAYWRHSVLVFRGQRITREQHIAFSARFGENDIHIYKQFLDKDYPQLIRLSNVHGQTGVVVDNYWHADLTYYAEPTGGAVLYCYEAPSKGADTLFVSLIDAYDRLPGDVKRRLNGLTAIHSHEPYGAHKRPKLNAVQEEKAPDMVHPVVAIHPRTGRRILFVNEGFTTRIAGWAQAESDQLLKYLYSHSTGSDFVYRHLWHPGDVVIWDNRSTVHSATPWDTSTERRHLERTTIKGERPVMAPD